MNLAVIGVACGAAVLSTVAISRGGGEQAAATGSLKIENAYIAYQDGQPGTRLSMTDGGEATLQDVLDKIAKQMQLPLHVRWDRLDQRDVHKDSQVVIVGRDLEVPEVFKRINEGEAFQHATLDFRADHGVLEIADREFFDRRERTLATYDVSAVLDGRTSEDRQKVMEEVAKTITQFASPEDWRENGGELGVLTAVDGKLFVEAPPRMHRQVKWILDQLKGEAQQKPKADAGGRVDVRRFPLAHTSASEVLRTLQGLDGIKEIDFSRFTVDARTNSILCMGDQAVEDRVKGALAVLDRPAPKVETLDTFGNPVAPAQKP